MLFPTMNVFVDGGGNHCDTVRVGLKRLPHFDKVYVFEPNPNFHGSYGGSGFILLKKAIWTHDGVVPFHVSRDERQIASSVHADKLCKVNSSIVPNFHDRPLDVECVDFSRWLRDNARPGHAVTLKLDIEGAEYEVLRKLIDDGTIRLVNKLYVEFHDDTLRGRDSRPLKAELDGLGVTAHDWD